MMMRCVSSRVEVASCGSFSVSTIDLSGYEARSINYSRFDFNNSKTFRPGRQSDRDSIVLLRLLMILYRGEEGCTICS